MSITIPDMIPATATEDGDPQANNSFMCPITHQLFVDPVIASDGFSYERSAIDQWFRSSDKSPVTGMKITRTFIPNHSLRNAVQEVYPQQADLFKARSVKPTEVSLPEPHSLPTQGPDDVSDFDFSKEEIYEMIKSKFESLPPVPGTVYYGLFEQQFQEGDFLAKSTWTIRMEFDSIQDYTQPPILTATITWRKNAQTFNNPVESFQPDLREFATALNRSVGRAFVCKIRGTYDSNTGRLEMYTFEANKVGDGFFTLLLGQSGETLDGMFYLRNVVDPSHPALHGRGILRLRRFTQ